MVWKRKKARRMTQIKLHGESSRTNYNPFTKKFQNYPWRNKLTIDDKLTIDCKNNIEFYVVLNDRIFILIDEVNLEYCKRLEVQEQKDVHVSLKAHDHEYDKNNILCYNKNTGKLLWQVDNSDESPFTGLGIKIKDKEEEEVKYKLHKINGEKIGIILKQPFNKKEDLFKGGTFSCAVYTIDIDTGKIKIYAQSK